MSKSLHRGMPNTWEDFPARKNEAGQWLCKKCGKTLDGRKTAWCGKDCLEAVLLLVHWPRIRRKVLRRDKYRCQICGNRGNEVDHIIEIQDGGLSVMENLRTLCHNCHKRKTWMEKQRRAAAKRSAVAAEAAKPHDHPNQKNDCADIPESNHIISSSLDSLASPSSFAEFMHSRRTASDRTAPDSLAVDSRPSACAPV